MRMWMVSPDILCRRHLLGEHVETHMFLGALKKTKNLDGYIENNLFQPMQLASRHQELLEEMLQRGYNHNSSLDFDYDLLNYLSDTAKYYRVDKNKSLRDLINRCPDCKKRYEEKI